MENTKLTAERLKLEIVKSDSITPLRVSSSRAYDRVMQEVFPYHVKITHEQGAELSGLLSRGAKHGPNLEYEFFPSFALLMNFDGEYGPKGGRVLWMSQASFELLKMHEDLYEIVLIDYSTPPQWRD